ncbi:hypothetical protein AVEN_151678-1 [Araneus ventricosus]|uniref:Mutator-like transposase domain-containing protein n=1 Tax=Araneus ventricosus TaxID=182803 RepID=A0A4Y2Q4I4_ARAVE|nr:hypothetical protein AVEN_151678-1 [Araneus ventricosus]
MRIIGKEHSVVKKLCSALNVNVLSKTALWNIEKKLEGAANDVASEVMEKAALELRKAANGDEIIHFAVSVDGTWQRRGCSHLNEGVSAISVDNGKILDIELRSKICRFCIKETSANVNSFSNCSKYTDIK